VSGLRASFDASDVEALRDELRRVPAEVTKRNRVTLVREIKAVTRGWQARARVTAGDHGKLYPGTIRDEMAGPLEAVTGPISALPQGGMGPGFEWGHPTVASRAGNGWFIGSEKYPPAGEWRRGGFAGQRVGQTTPHLDMTKTMDEQEPIFVEKVAGDVLPWW
jgi:hypothetical protein